MILTPIQPTDPIIGPSRGDAQGWIDWITRHRSEVKRPDDAIAFIRAVYTLCAPDDMPDAFIVVAQAFVETGNFSNRWWAERLNAGSLGVTGDDAQNEASPTFRTPEEAARAMIAHLLLYALGAIDRGGLKPSDDPRYLAYREEYGSSVFPTLQLLAGRWAADPFYANKIADRQEEIYPIFTVPVEPPAGGTPVVRVNFRADLIPAGNSNRPGFLLNTDDRLIGITQHTTGNTNPNAGAEMHCTFTHNGGGSDNVSFHFVVDDRIVIQLLPVYEGAYHAADGCDNRATDIGCFDTVAIELCVNAGADWGKAKDNLARLYAMLWTGDPRIIGIDRVTVQNGRVYTHQQVSDTNKYCPQQILDEGSLPVIVAQGQTYAGASPEVPGPVYAKPIIPGWLANDDGVSIETINRTKVYPVHLTYTAIRDTPRKQATGRNTNLVGPDIKKGETFQAGRAYRSAGRSYVLTTYGTRVQAADLTPKVQITTSGVVSVRYER